MNMPLLIFYIGFTCSTNNIYNQTLKTMFIMFIILSQNCKNELLSSVERVVICLKLKKNCLRVTL